MSIFNHFRHAHLSHQTLFGNQNWKIFLQSWNCCSCWRWCCYFNIVAVVVDVVVVGVILVVHGVVVDVVVNVVDYEIKTVLGRLSLFSLLQFSFLLFKLLRSKEFCQRDFTFIFNEKKFYIFYSTQNNFPRKIFRHYKLETGISISSLFLN